MNDVPEQPSPCLALVPVDLSPKPKHAGGRPTVMTQETIGKLASGVALGGTDTDACRSAGLSIQTLDGDQNRYPQFAARKALLKETPVHLARTTIVNQLGDLNNAQ